MMDNERPPEVTASHRARKALIYVRQSTLRQVAQNQGSTADQEGQARHPRRWGWAARAIEVVAELLSERQRAELKRLNYEPGPVPADKLRTALLDLLGSDSWELRVRVLNALQLAGLDRGMTEAVERCLTHPHWLVRMMAVRLLARQGRPFAERAQSIADHDEDDLVRALAASYLERWATPTTEPSEKATE